MQINKTEGDIKMEQMDLFSVDWDSLPAEEPKAKVYSISKKIEEEADVRTKNQTNRKYAYDVGEKIFGSRKEMSQFALKRWEQQKTIEGLKEIEDLDNKMAAEIITRDTFFSSFSLEAEKENGVEPQVARLKQLIIQRIDKVPRDDEEARHFYFIAATWVKKQLDTAYNWKEMLDVIYFIRSHAGYLGTVERREKRIKTLEDEIAFFKADPERMQRNLKEIETFEKSIEKAKEEIVKIQLVESLRLRGLGSKFSSFFKWDAKSANKTIDTVFSTVSTWDDLLGKKQAAPTKRRRNLPVWERIMPDNPSRIGGFQSTIHTSADLMNTFNFRGVQFGNWAGDSYGSTHIFKSSEGFYDLADILKMKDVSHVSLNGTLGMAYGARGRGNALAHYERGQTVINITRNHLGSLGHEWAHALDNFLYRYSHDFKNGQEKMLSELDNIGEKLPAPFVQTYRELILMFSEGRAVRYEPYNGERYSRIPVKYLNLYEEYKDDILGAMKEVFESEEADVNSIIRLQNFYNSTQPGKLDARIDKAVKNAEKNLRLAAKVFAYIHLDETGEQLEEVPVPTFTTAFYEASLILDRNAKGKYWTSNVEMFARTFEAWLEDKLKKQDRRNDYLVCGTNDPVAYPQGEERIKINKQFDLLFEQLKEVDLFTK